MNELSISPWHLKYFYDAGRLLSLSKAADCNRITRPAISKAIRTLEGVLNVELLVHQKRNVELTSHGKALLERIPNILQSLIDLKEYTQGISDVPKGTLRVGTSHSLALSMFPRLIRNLKKRYPELKLNLQLGRTEILRGWLTDHSIDLAITLDDQKPSEFRRLLIGEGRFVLFGQGKINQRPILTTFKRPEVQAFHQWYEGKFKMSCETLEVDSWEVLFRFAKEDLGIALVPDFVLAFEKNTNHQNKVRFDCTYSMIGLTQKSVPSRTNVEAVVAELRSIAFGE